MSFLNAFKSLSLRASPVSTFARNISQNTRHRLTKSKSQLLLEVPAAYPIKPATSVVEGVTTFDVPTKVATFEHPLPPVISTNPDVVKASQQIFAVVDIQGRQFKVTENDMVMVNYIKGVEVGDQLAFDHVYLVAGRNFTVLGKPFVPKVSIVATVREQTTTKEINVFKMKRRTGYRKLMRYRDMVTILQINKIDVEGELPQVAPLEQIQVNKMQEPVQL